ncbi:peptidylprolyl isomerase [Confluentibacter citreus]|uniref:peptidylprolyl isomerase n=1 Tax=Confluentibacter citreus TaxID=2007307 RepID=UPI000C294FC2
MPLKINNLKFIINLKHIVTLSLTLLLINVITAQEIIEDEKVETPTEVKVDSIEAFKPRKVDGVAAVVGDFIVLESDIPKERQQLIASGANLDDVTDCQLFGRMLESKLYAHHAIQDSIIVSDAEVKGEADYVIDQFLQEMNGSMERLVAFYRKENEKSLRDEMFESIKNNKLSARMQEKIVEEVEITPEEVRQFFNKIPKEQRPTFGTELKVAEIVVDPKVSVEDKQKIIDRLNEFKRDVIENGASFRTKAVLYSDDKESGRAGGSVGTMHRDKPKMVKEFRDVAFSMREGDISDPFETDFGFHIIKVEKIRGKEYDVSHILLIPKVSDEALKEAKERIDKIRQKIVAGELTFAEAAKESSDRKETRGDGGQMINPKTQDYKFELTKMDTELYTQIQNLKDNEVSPVVTETERTGKVKFKILTVTGRIDDHEADYATDYLKIKELALNEKQIKTIEEWQEEKIMDTYIKIGEAYKDCDFSSNWLKK